MYVVSVRPKKVFLVKHVSVEELRSLIQTEPDKRIYERLLFIHQLYMKNDVYDACERLCIANQTGYNWLKAWNRAGYAALKPRFGGGRPSKLTERQREELRKALGSKDHWLTGEVRDLIARRFNVQYSMRQVARILRSLGMHYSKPYPEDYRRPENAEKVLRERLNEALKKAEGDVVLGFLDESSPQTTDNRQRFWGFGKKKITRNTTRIRANTFGFIPVNGRSALSFKDDSRKESVCEFLREIRERNPAGLILIVLDNFRSHVARATRELAESLGMVLVYLPPYSPDLNPIEQVWRGVRRKISQGFVRCERSFKETIKATFHLLAKRKTFMSGWLNEFQPFTSKKI